MLLQRTQQVDLVDCIFQHPLRYQSFFSFFLIGRTSGVATVFLFISFSRHYRVRIHYYTVLWKLRKCIWQEWECYEAENPEFGLMRSLLSDRKLNELEWNWAGCLNEQDAWETNTIDLVIFLKQIFALLCIIASWY